MASNNGKHQGPPCPKIERLEELMDSVAALRANLSNPEAKVHGYTYSNVLDEITSALDWTHTMLSNRKTYQKHNQLVRKARLDIADKLLSPDEKKAIEEQVQRDLGNWAGGEL